MNDINNAELPLYFHRLLSHADDMENDPEVSIPVAVETVGREQVEYLTVENIENLETSSSLSNSQDSYMREINQGNNKSNLELNIPEMPIPSSFIYQPVHITPVTVLNFHLEPITVKIQALYNQMNSLILHNSPEIHIPWIVRNLIVQFVFRVAVKHTTVLYVSELSTHCVVFK